MRTLKNAGAGVAHNPTSNLKLASGVAPVAQMLELGLNVGIGTDGPASNNDLDMFEEMRLAALLAKGVERRSRPRCPARQALAMATRIGARRVHLGDLTGSLEPGKRADLIVVDLERLHNVPRVRPRSERHLLADRLRRQVHRRRRRDVQRPVADARSAAADAGRGRRCAPRRRDVARRIDAFLISREAERAAEAGRDRRRRRSRRASRSRSRRAWPSPSTVLAALAGDEITVDPRRPLPPVRHVLLLRRSGAGPAALSRGRVPRRRAARSSSARARLTLTGPSREAAFGSVLLFRSRYLRARDALAALLPRVLPAGARARRREGSAPMAGRVPRRRSSTCTSIA